MFNFDQNRKMFGWFSKKILEFVRHTAGRSVYISTVHGVYFDRGSRYVSFKLEVFFHHARTIFGMLLTCLTIFWYKTFSRRWAQHIWHTWWSIHKERDRSNNWELITATHLYKTSFIKQFYQIFKSPPLIYLVQKKLCIYLFSKKSYSVL